ncbi:universal stress protein [Guyparkeria sp. SCN-R1]|uniref:universal stress protein n=1 Tax=Guyparkeria sp. SCN-R1 TaxID=2341113 RepID=UPI000F64B265|nr:universal stress protein [Guyparkeria sp. SCN-R1]RRQ24771.1 universal stress protein [Guyparkeria sp. SCN-R1]
MAKHPPILVASDLSNASEVAVTRAMQMASGHGHSLTVLHVIREEPLWWLVKSRDVDPDELRGELLREALAELDLQLEGAAGQLAIEPPESEAQVRLGKPAAVINDMSSSIEACLIVVGAHGRHAVRDWFIGTTAEKVVRAGNVPVLVARVEPTHSYQKVVVAVDFSESSRAALREALAWVPRAQFTLVHAYETWLPTHVDASTYERLQREEEGLLRDRLRQFAHEAGVHSEHEPDYRVLPGPPGATVANAAVNAHADLTVCGTQGETGLRHLLLGSVAQHILRESKGDVLTVRAGGTTG